MRTWLFHHATALPRVDGLVLVDPGLVVAQFVRDCGGRLAWWGLWIRDPDRDLMAAWWSAEWWYLAKWRYVLGPVFRFARRVGVWSVPECGLFVDGHLQWPDMWTRREP